MSNTRGRVGGALMGSGVVIGGVVVGLLVLGGGAFLSFTTEVGPDEFAVKQVYLGPNKGVHDELYGPGWHFVLPSYERLHIFPRDLQILDFNEDEHRIEVDYHSAEPIRIQTSEGYQVTVDVTVLYRITDPRKVLTEVGPGKLYEDRVVKRLADRALRQTLGALNADDFYHDIIRSAKAEEARSELEKELAEWGIQVWGVLIRDYTYDPRYQQAIEDRKIQDQKVFKNQAEGYAALQEAELERVRALGRATIDIESQRGMTEARMIAADADLYYRQKISQGALLIDLAEAEGTRLENSALQSAGASNMVGLKMAEALEGTQIIMVSTTGPNAMNPLDLNTLIRGW